MRALINLIVGTRYSFSTSLFSAIILFPVACSLVFCNSISPTMASSVRLEPSSCGKVIGMLASDNNHRRWGCELKILFNTLERNATAAYINADTAKRRTTEKTREHGVSKHIESSPHA